ncbi:MAG: FAD:protein FMN transferase [Myxococcota bacterium]
MMRVPAYALASLLVVAGLAACQTRSGVVPSEPASAAVSGPAAQPSAGPSAEPSAGSGEVLPADTQARATGVRVNVVEEAMGTRIVLASFTTEAMDAGAVTAALRSGFREIQRLEALMTSWREDSEVSGINRAAGREPVMVSPETLDVITKSLWISERSEGTFDITFASMGKLWRFDQDRIPLIPAAEALETARRRIDYKQVRIDPAARTVMLARPETKISLGGIAKGYAVDRAAVVMRQAGLSAFYVQAGGDLYVEGTKPDGKPWTVGVRDPRGAEGDVFAVLPVTNHAFSTAGDYERAFVKGGQRFHHIIDPRTGYPATESRSVTVWAADALTADAIDDAVFILGPDKGLELVESIDGCGAVIVDKDNQVWVSSRLEGLVQMIRDPTPGI